MVVGIVEARDRGGAHRGLGGQHHIAGCRGGAGRQFKSRGDGVLGHLERQTVAHGSLGVEAHSEQQGRPGDLGSDRAVQHPGGTPAGMDAELLKARVEHRMRPGDAHVGGQGEVHPGPDGGAVDRGDGGKRAASDGHEARIKAFQSFGGRRTQRREVGAGAEGLARAGDDYGMDAGVGFGALYRVAQQFRGDLGDRVAPIRVVDRDHRDSVGHLVQDRISHKVRG